jgi:hypothetical protein
MCKGEKFFVIAESGEKGLKSPKTGGCLRISVSFKPSLFPFLDRNEFKQTMLVPLIEE